MDRGHAGCASAEARTWAAGHPDKSSHLCPFGRGHFGVLQVERGWLSVPDQCCTSHGGGAKFNWSSKSDNAQARRGLTLLDEPGSSRNGLLSGNVFFLCTSCEDFWASQSPVVQVIQAVIATTRCSKSTFEATKPALFGHFWPSSSTVLPSGLASVATSEPNTGKR